MGKGRKPVILSKGQAKISSFFVKQSQQAQSTLSDRSSTNLSNQNTADACLEGHTSPSIFKKNVVKSPDKPSSPDVVLSHDELLSFPKVGENSVDENCDIIYPTPKKTSPVKRKALGEVSSPDTIPATPTAKSRNISLACQNKKHSKLGMLKLGKHFSGKRNKQGISLIDLLDNAYSADGIEDRVFSISNPELRNQDASANKKVKLDGDKSIFTEDGQSSHGTNIQVFSDKSTVNERPAKDHATQNCISRTNVEDCTELDSLLQMPAAFLENSVLCNPDASKDIVSDCSVTKTDIRQYEDLKEPKQCTDVTDGTVSSNKIVFSDVLHLNSNCGSVGSSNIVSGCDILSGKDRNQETEIVLSKQAAFKESNCKPDLINLKTKCSDCSVESSDQCAGALCGNEQTAAGTSAVQQVKTASCSSHITEDQTAWLSFDSSDFFMIEDEETECAVLENYEELSLDTFQRCEIMDVNTGNKKQEKIVKLRSTHSKTTTVCLLQDYWADINLENGDIVSIKASRCEKTSHSVPSWFINNSVGLLVPHPDTLISSTAVVGSLFCPRRGVLSEWFRGIDSDSTIMVIGSLVHELFQEVLKNKLSTLSAIKNVVQELLSRSHCIQMLYSARMSKEDAMKALEGFVPHIANFVNTHVRDSSHKTAASSPPPNEKNKNVNNAEKWDGTISAIHDIEENIWAPRLGIKGKVDVTVEVKINRHKKTLTKVMPLELKTGRSSFSAEHKGQVILYTMMMSELGNNVDSGLLLYLRDGLMQEVKSGNNECRDLILLRNNLAHFITRIPALMDDGAGFKPPQLPEPINHRSACAKCPYLTLCSSFLGEKRGKCLCSMVITSTVTRIGDSYIHTLRKHCDQFSDLPKSGFTVGEYVTVSTDNRLTVATGTICDITQCTLTLSLNRSDIVRVTEVRLSSKSDTLVLELVWNPGITNILAVCLSDGSMATYELKPSGVDISTLPPATQANCFCWSPKGKQLVVGSEGGTLTQYKPDLKAVKTFSPPNLGSGSVAVVNVLWLSNYQFAAIYKDKVNPDERPGLLIVNAPKTGPLTFVNYEDICYSGGNLRAPQYYLIHQPTWNILMVASANSMEVGVLGLQEDQISWEQWTQEDAARAELPLSVDKQETFPVGFGLDTSTQHELPWGENQSIAPMPVLYILSHQGVLCLFYAVNLRPNAACLCSPPEKLPDESGFAMFTTIPTEDQSQVNNMSPEVLVTADPQHSAGDGVGKTRDKSLEFSTPLHSGAALTSLDDGVGDTQVPLTQKFETGSTSQPSSSFAFGTTLSSVSSSGSQAGLGKAPSTSFGTNPAGALSASFGTGVTITPSSGYGASLTGTSFAGFGASSGVFGTAVSNPPATSLSHTSTSNFGTGALNPASTAFGTSHGTASSVSFGTGPVAQSSIGTGSSVSNPPNFGFGAGLKFPASVPAAKPVFSFLSSTAATLTTTVTTTTTAAAANLKPAPVQTTTSFIFTAPMTATAAAASTANLKPPPVQTTTSFIFTAPTTTTVTAASTANLKPAPVQTAANFMFTAPTLTSTPIAQQPSKLTTPLAIPQLQSTPVKPQASVISSSSASSVQNPDQMFGSSVTITKVPPAAVPSTQSVRVAAPTSDVKLPTHNQMKQATPPTAAAPVKPAVNNSVFYNAINEEIIHFDSELAALRSRVNGLSVEVGSEDEKRILCLKADAMDEFWRELKDTTQAQSLEIHCLKCLLMEAFAWLEETKSRTQQLNCPMYIQLAQSQALDPVSARYIANIKQLVYYVENQLRQSNEQLDSRWLEFQDSCKPSVKNKMHIPSLESVYQAMVMQNNILNKQRAIMADIARRAQEQGRSTQIPLISSAVLARVREKEDAQLNKGETELSELAESLVKMKLGPYDVQTGNGTGVHYHHLSRKKESLLRGVLSQRTVTRLCPTKPSRTTMGGISTGKPILNKSDIVVVTATPTSVAGSSKVTSTLSAGVAITEPKHSPIINVMKSDSPQSPLFLFGSASSSGKHDAVSKSVTSKGFSSVGTKSGSANKETLSGKSVATSSGIFAPTVESSTAKPNVFDSTLSISGSRASDVKNKGTTVGEFSFTSGLHNDKSSDPGNFSFGLGLNSVPSFGKLNDASKKLEDHYEDLSPPGSPEYSHGEAVSSTGSSVSSSSFKFNFAVTPTTTRASIVPSSSNRRVLSPLLTTPIMSLNNIVAGIGDSDGATKPTKPVVDNKSIEMSSANNTTSGTAFSFGSLSLGQPQQGGSGLGKADEPRKSSHTFAFSLAGSLSSPVPTPSPAVSSSGDMSQATSPKSSAATTTGVNLKTPLLTGLGTQNLDSNSSPLVNIFGAVVSQEPSSFVSSGNTSVSSSSTNMFAQAATSMFGNLTTGSPAKQPVSLGNIFGAAPNSSGTTGKESTDSTTSAEPELQKPESTPKSQSLATSSFENENLFSQSSLLLGSLSIGSEASSKAVSPGSIFRGGSDPLASNFVFGKQSASTESQNNIGIQNAPEPTVATESPETQVQKSESPSKNTQGAASTPSSTPSFDQTPASPNENSKSSEGTETQVVPNTTQAYGSAKTESTTAFSFGQLASSPSAPQTPVVLGQTKPLTGSIFGAVVTPPATSQQTVTPLTSAATTMSPAAQTSSSANTTFSFSLPTSAPSSTPFGQKTTSIFGQPVSSDAPATTSSGSFFGQPICSPIGFGQSGENLFGQPAATTAAKTNIFGQSPATTTAPSVFGQGNTSTKPNIFGQTSASFFGQAPATGSPFLSGGFGSKPTFGQSGGSIFGQSSSSGFGTSGTSIFGGGSNVFGGSSGSSSGSLFQSSTGGNIFGGSASSGGSAAGGGAFSSGLGQSIIQSGFGTTTAFQSKPGGFGGSPVFDRGTSGFGSSPTFGGAPTFGGSPTFGSSGKVFGSSSSPPSAAFGSAGQQSSSFESLASQNTMTFGNLAQNQSQGFVSPTQSIFGGNQTQQQASAPAFSSGGSTFGGSSFSSWR